MHFVEIGELPLPDSEWKLPVMPLWVGGRITCINPRTILNVNNIIYVRSIIFKIFADPYSLNSGI
ncbi:hypothetical protein D3C80_1591520 [compost metagenome]